MMRLRNEEEFLEAAVRSLASKVDEFVLIDNLSTDGTPDVMRRLKSTFPTRIATYRYDHDVARVGSETWKLATQPVKRRSPRLLSNYYNWCLQRCNGPYVLKWDGDMIALDSLRRELQSWKSGGRPVMVMQGLNVHRGFENVVVEKSADRASLLGSLEVPGLPGWVTNLTYDYLEPRLFPKLFAHYSADILWTQMLRSPFRLEAVRRSYARILQEPAFLHLKFCKRDPVANYSRDLAAVIEANVERGRRLETEHQEELIRWGIVARDSEPTGRCSQRVPRAVE
jgi:glycosyltransferase involved in cell wall biosynthesis